MRRTLALLMSLAMLTASGFPATAAHPQTPDADMEQERLTVPAVSTSSIIGEIRDARNLDPSVIFPDGLPLVAGAHVEVPELGLSTTSDANGRFRFDNVSVVVADQARPYRKVAVQVRANGFGLWQIVDAPVRPEGNYLRLTVDLRARAHTVTYTPPEERPAEPPNETTGTSSSIGSSGGKLARPMAASRCTGFVDHEFPPGSIRVFRPAFGDVWTVNFMNYVKNVLPNEWTASSDHMEALKAGAVAVKMYGWQRVNTGSPFGGFHNGQCWDVDNTETYQVWHPNVAHQRTDFAVASTWAVIVKRGSVILEGLHLRGDTECLREDGITLHQLGSVTCANTPHNKLWDAILTTYYDNITIDWMGGGPAVAATPTIDRLDLFVRGRDGNVYQKFWDPTGWNPGGWTTFGLGPLPIRAASDPSAGWSMVGGSEMGRLDVAVRGINNVLYVNTWTSSGWSGWYNIASGVTAGPAVVPKRYSTGMDILWRNSEHHLKRHTLVGSQFQATTPDPPQLPTTPDASAVWDPAGAWWQASGHLELFTSSNDAGQQIYQTTYVASSNSWTQWNPQGSGVLPAPPTGGVQGKPALMSKDTFQATRLDIVIRGANEQLQWRYWSPAGAWTEWTNIGTPTANHMQSGPGAIWWHNDAVIDLFVRGENGWLYQRSCVNGCATVSDWQGWIALEAYP